MRQDIILASGSVIRARILKAAGVGFAVMKPDVDEAAVKRACGKEGLDLEATAMRLAESKALAVEPPSGALVVGSDQILEFEGRAYDKCESMDEARARLLALSGRPHTLVNAVAVARDGDVLFRRIDRPRLMMRDLSAAEIDRYLAEAGEEILASVGAYQVEGLGARLFERIDGDYFAVLGLSLFPLLSFLRRAEAVDY